MTPEIFKYVLVFTYMAVILWLSWVGMRKTTGIAGFAIGNKDMNPYLIGITLAASIASTATFVINPGFVYVHGLSAFLHFGIAASAGIVTAFLVLTKGFLRVGEANQSITIPDWILHRYGSRGLSLFFAVINLLSITFVVLILVGCSILMTGLFPLDQKQSLVLILIFVFSYVLMGGTYAHAYTNSLQGIMMLLIALFLVIEGSHHLGDDIFTTLKSQGESYAAVFNPDSPLYYDFFSVFLSGFVVTFTLMLQPHILTKVLYLKNEGDIRKFILSAVVVGFCFSFMLMLGFYAKFAGLEIPAQDAVVREYLLYEFGNSEWGRYLLTFIFITLLAAGMSTLDGILVSLSAMVINDIVNPLFGVRDNALVWSRVFLVLIGGIALFLAWNPPPLIGLFAQKGVYGLAAASAAPILFGVLYQKQIPTWVVGTSAAIGLVGHLLLNLFLGFENPAVSATISTLASVLFVLACLLPGALRAR